MLKHVKQGPAHGKCSINKSPLLLWAFLKITDLSAGRHQQRLSYSPQEMASLSSFFSDPTCLARNGSKAAVYQCWEPPDSAISFSLLSNTVGGAVLIPILQKRELRLQEVKDLLEDQAH